MAIGTTTSEVLLEDLDAPGFIPEEERQQPFYNARRLQETLKGVIEKITPKYSPFELGSKKTVSEGLMEGRVPPVYKDLLESESEGRLTPPGFEGLSRSDLERDLSKEDPRISEVARAQGKGIQKGPRRTDVLEKYGATKAAKLDPETQTRLYGDRESNVSEQQVKSVEKNFVADIIDAGKRKKDPKEVADAYMKEFMDVMPEYEGKTPFEKGMDLTKLGMAIAAGQDPNAIANITKGFLAMGDTFTEDAKERREFNRQLKVSAAKHTLDRIGEDRADSKDYKFFYNTDGDMEVLSVAELAEGERPSKGFVEKEFADVIIDSLDAQQTNFIANLERTKLAEGERKEYVDGYKDNIELHRKALLGQELTAGLQESLSEGGKTGLTGSVINLTESAKAIFGIKQQNYKINKKTGKLFPASRKQFIADMRKVFQLMIPLTLGQAQSANSISDRDVDLLAKAAVAKILNDDNPFGDLFKEDPDTLNSKLKRASVLFREKAASSKNTLSSLDKRFAGSTFQTVRDGKIVTGYGRELVEDFKKGNKAFDRGEDRSGVISWADYESQISSDLAGVDDALITGLTAAEIERLPTVLKARARELQST